MNNNGSQHSAFYRTEDDGATVSCVLELPAGLMIQAIREDSARRGSSSPAWTASSGRARASTKAATPEELVRLPGGGLPARIAASRRTANGSRTSCSRSSGTRPRTRAARTSCWRRSPARPTHSTWGEWTEGLFRTGDAGRTWTDISAGLPFKRNRTATLVCVTADPSHPGRVFAASSARVSGGARTGAITGRRCSRSTAAPSTQARSLSAAPGADDLYVSCEPLGLSPCLRRSCTARTAAARGRTSTTRAWGPAIKTIAVNPVTGTIELGTCGNGSTSASPR